MSPKASLVEINGQLYDAKSGRLFHHPRGPVIDGFIKKSRPEQAIKQAAKTASSSFYKPAQTVHMRAQRSHTLMRRAVKKPHTDKDLGPKLKSPKARTGAPNQARLSRAKNMIKSARVNRFGLPSGHSKSMGISALRTKPAPSSGAGQSSTSTAVALRPPSLITSVSHQRLERMLDEALYRADAHKKALNGRSKGRRRLGFVPKWLAVSIMALVVVSVGGFLAWRNIPYVSMKFASLRAQVQGSLPNYVPSGFKFAGPVKHQGGSVSMTFKSEGSRSFTLEQEASSLNSASLKANTVPDQAQVHTSQVRGATVYYNSANNEATWVTDGKRYKLRGELPADEVFKIADSVL